MAKVKKTESEQWEEENKDPEVIGKSQEKEIPGMAEAKEIEAKADEATSPAEKEMMLKIALAGKRQVQCNICLYDKQYNHDIKKCEKFPDGEGKKLCKTLIKMK